MTLRQTERNVRPFGGNKRIYLREENEGYSQEFAFGGPRLEYVGYGDGGVSVGEVWVVSAAGNGDSEPVPRDSGQSHVVVLPHDPFPALKHRKKNTY